MECIPAGARRSQGGKKAVRDRKDGRDRRGRRDRDGALGEFFFLPVGSEQDTVGHFIASITLTDQYDMERSPELYAAMAILNTYIPCGAFSVSRDETVLMYKLVTPMPVALTKEALREEVDICMGNAIAVCDRYADLLLKVLDGEMDKDAVMEALGM